MSATRAFPLPQSVFLQEGGALRQSGRHPASSSGLPPQLGPKSGLSIERIHLLERQF